MRLARSIERLEQERMRPFLGGMRLAKPIERLEQEGMRRSLGE
jgi:hypothetical protein